MFSEPFCYFHCNIWPNLLQQSIRINIPPSNILRAICVLFLKSILNYFKGYLKKEKKRLKNHECPSYLCWCIHKRWFPLFQVCHISSINIISFFQAMKRLNVSPLVFYLSYAICRHHTSLHSLSWQEKLQKSSLVLSEYSISTLEKPYVHDNV